MGQEEHQLGLLDMKEYKGFPTTGVVGTCPVCGRDFLQSTCDVHCGPVCCRGHACPNVRGAQKAHVYYARFHKKCVVCGKGGPDFVRFAPCNRKPRSEGGCQGSYCPDDWGRGQFWTCYSLADPAHFDHWHRPTEKPRFHIKYCSLKCYNSPTGHLAKVKELNRSKWRKRGAARRDHKDRLRSEGLTTPGG